MKNQIDLIAFAEIKRMMNFTSLESDLILVDDISMVAFSDKPAVNKMSITAIIDSGTIDLAINLNRYTISAPALITLIPGHITQSFSISDNFKGLIISGSNQFISYLEINLQKALPIFLELKNKPFITLTLQELALLKEYYFLLKKGLNLENNTNRQVVAKNLMHALFYQIEDIFRKNRKVETENKTRQEATFESFLKYVQLYYRHERELAFYADKLCLTPKYLSLVIKTTTDKSANEWIDSYVILEAQALLKSSNMTILQISDELNFPSQSFFGKYFKRHVGMSPKEYKQS